MNELITEVRAAGGNADDNETLSFMGRADPSAKRSDIRPRMVDRMKTWFQNNF